MRSDHAAQGFFLNDLQEWRLHNLPGLPASLLDHLDQPEPPTFPVYSPTSSWEKLGSLVSAASPWVGAGGCRGRVASPAPLAPSHRATAPSLTIPEVCPSLFSTRRPNWSQHSKRCLKRDSPFPWFAGSAVDNEAQGAAGCPWCQDTLLAHVPLGAGQDLRAFSTELLPSPSAHSLQLPGGLPSQGRI